MLFPQSVVVVASQNKLLAVPSDDTALLIVKEAAKTVMTVGEEQS
jgi:hypothetical protein